MRSTDHTLSLKILVVRNFSISDRPKWEGKVIIKSYRFQRPPRDYVENHLATSTILQTNSSKIWKKPEKISLGQCIVSKKDSLVAGSKRREIPSPRQPSTDKTENCVVNSERGACSGLQPTLRSLSQDSRDVWRPLARRMTIKQEHLTADVPKTVHLFSFCSFCWPGVGAIN